MRTSMLKCLRRSKNDFLVLTPSDRLTEVEEVVRLIRNLLPIRMEVLAHEAGSPEENTYGWEGYARIDEGVAKIFLSSKDPQEIAALLLHEIGHLLGLPHCRDPKCVMRDSLWEEGKGLWICRRCREKFLSAIGGD